MPARPVSVFISHAHAERALADAWKDLLKNISLAAVDVWYSSDPRGGIRVGEDWRREILRHLKGAHYVIALQSSVSLDRPWILWECGYAKGQGRPTILVTYDTRHSEMSSAFAESLVYDGTTKTDVERVCRGFLERCQLRFDERLFRNEYKRYSQRIVPFARQTPVLPALEVFPDIMAAVSRAFEVVPRPRQIDLMGHSTSRLYAYVSQHLTSEAVRVMVRNPDADGFLLHIPPLSRDAERDNIRAALRWWQHLAGDGRPGLALSTYDFEPSFCLVMLDSTVAVVALFIPNSSEAFGHDLGSAFLISARTAAGQTFLAELARWYAQTTALKAKRLDAPSDGFLEPYQEGDDQPRTHPTVRTTKFAMRNGRKKRAQTGPR